MPDAPEMAIFMSRILAYPSRSRDRCAMIGGMALMVRPAGEADDPVLGALDRRSWEQENEVSPRAEEGRPFFSSPGELQDVLVAELESRLAGWVKVCPPTRLASNAHVQQIQGLAVDPLLRRRGIGVALLEAAFDLARSRGARRITLRVLETNAGARALYERSGFRVEGRLPGEFYLAGRYVDDVLMGRSL
jgi:ribosomal protein S18 acetylase RimI-like enzyme